MDDPSTPSGSHPVEHAPEELEKALEFMWELHQGCADMLQTGRRLSEVRARSNRHQWRRHLREIGMSKNRSEELMELNRLGVTVEELADALLTSGEQRLGLPPIADDPEWSGHDDHRDGEADR